MAYIQKSPPQPNKVIPFTLSNMTGGINNRSTIPASNQASDLLNMTFYNEVIMEKRKGSKTFKITLYDFPVETYPEYQMTDPITFLGQYKPYNQDKDVLFRSSDTKTICSYVGEYDYPQTFALNGRMDVENFLGHMYFTDGSGLYAYGQFPWINNTYNVAVGSSYVENSDYVMKVVNPPATFTPLPSPHKKGVTHYDFDAKQIWYEPCQAELDDPYKGANVLPENPQFITSLLGRLYLSGASKDNDNVYLTDAGNPFYCPVSLPLQVPPNSDKVSGLFVYDNSVLVSRSYDMHAITGMTNNPSLGLEMFKISKVNVASGFVNNRCVNVAQNFLFYLAHDGNIYSMSSARQNEKILSTTMINNTLDLFASPFNFTLADLTDACSIYHHDMWYLSIKDKVFVFSFRHKAWTVFNNLNIRSFYILDDVMIWGNDKGQICTWSDDYLDQDAPYPTYWSSIHFDMNDPFNFKQFRQFFVELHTYENYMSNIRIKFELDYAEIKSKAIIKNQIARFGVSRFGDRFLTKNINTTLPFVLGQRARKIRFTFYNGYSIAATVINVADLPLNNISFDTMYYVSGTNEYYVYTENGWVLQTTSDLNQPMRIYQVNGEYEIRGKR